MYDCWFSSRSVSQEIWTENNNYNGRMFSFMFIGFINIFSCWQAVWISTISLGFGYILIQSILATIAFDIVSETKGLSSGLIGLCLFSGGGLGTAFSGYLLSRVTYRTLWTIMAFGIISFILHCRQTKI